MSDLVTHAEAEYQTWDAALKAESITFGHIKFCFLSRVLMFKLIIVQVPGCFVQC